MSAVDAFRRTFDEKIDEISSKKGASSTILPLEKYHEIMRRLKEVTNGAKKEAKDYRMIKRYDIEVTKTSTATIERLFIPGTNLIYVAKSELFHVIHEIHILKGHGARDIMFHETKDKYANITREVLQLYVDLCEEWQLKRKNVLKSLPIISKAMNS